VKETFDDYDHVSIREVVERSGTELKKKDSRNKEELVFEGMHSPHYKTASKDGFNLTVWPDKNTWECTTCEKRGDRIRKGGPKAYLYSLLPENPKDSKEPNPGFEIAGTTIHSQYGVKAWLDEEYGIPPTQWEDPILFKYGRGPSLPSGLFPDTVEIFIDRYAESLEVPRDLMATPCLAAMSAVAAPRAIIKVPSWEVKTQTINIYALVVADSGERKTPAFKAATEPIRKLEIDLQRAEELDIAKHNSWTEVLKANKAAAQKEASKDVSDEDLRDAVHKASELLFNHRPKTVPSLITDDVTHQRLASLMYENDGAIAVFSDEGSFLNSVKGLWSSGEKNYEIYLHSWGGGDYRIDRVDGTSINLADPMLTICAAVQPSVLKTLAEDKGFMDRGFLPRFLMAVPEGNVGRRKITGIRTVPEGVKSAYENGLKRVFNLPKHTEDDPKIIQLSDEAHQALLAYAKRVEPDMYAPALGRLSGEGIQKVAAKFSAHAVKIAGTFHMFEHAGSDPIQTPLSEKTMLNAIRYIEEYNTEHWVAVAESIDNSGDYNEAHDVLRLIQRQRQINDDTGTPKLGVQFSIRDLSRISYKRNASKYHAALKTLEEYGWVREVETYGKRNHRKSRYELNPKAEDLWNAESEKHRQDRQDTPVRSWDTDEKMQQVLAAEEKTVVEIQSISSSQPSEKKEQLAPIYEVGSWELISDNNAAKEAVDTLLKEPILGIDTETTELDPLIGDLRLVQIAGKSHTYVFDLDLIGGKKVAEVLRPVLEGPSTKLFFNAAFDLGFLAHNLENIEIPNVACLMLADQIVKGGISKRSLKDVCPDYLGKRLNKEEQESDWGAKDLTRAQYEYAAIDAEVLLPIHDILISQAEPLGVMPTIELENRVIQAVVWMTRCGITFNKKEWAKLAEITQEKKVAVAKEMDELVAKELPNRDTSDPVKWNSHSQVRGVLKELGVEVKNTQAETLANHEHEHRLVELLLHYKELSTDVTKFGNKWIDKVSIVDGKIHPNWFQIGAGTGRMSCGVPNVQQIPNKEEYRNCFTPSEGNVFVKADYAQIELVVLAHITGDENLIAAFKAKKDLHSETARILMGYKTLAEVKKEDRDLAKAVNFGMIYGMKEGGLAKYAKKSVGINLSRKEAAKFQQKFLSAYPKVKAWQKIQKKKRQTRTILGRMRNTTHSTPNARLNSPVQGSAADGLKEALALLYESPERKKFNVGLAMAVHDDILLEVPEEYAEPAKEWLMRCMVQGMSRFIPDIPIKVEPSGPDKVFK